MIGLYIMTEKGFYVLSSIIDNFDFNIISFVVTERDPNLKKDYYDEIIDCCQFYGIPVFKRSDIDLPKVSHRFAISWKWLIKDSSDLIVLHDSLLPEYRGFNPLVTALINGDKKIGVTALYANEEADKGNIIACSVRDLCYPIKIHEAIQLIKTCYSDLVSNIIHKIMNQIELPSIPQDEKNASFSLWRDENDYHINWDDTAENINRFIDAVGFPYNGAYSFVNNVKIRVLDSKILPDINIINRVPGKVLKFVNGLPVIVCKQGLLYLCHLTDNEGGVFILKNLRTRFV